MSPSDAKGLPQLAQHPTERESNTSAGALTQEKGPQETLGKHLLLLLINTNNIEQFNAFFLSQKKMSPQSPSLSRRDGHGECSSPTGKETLPLPWDILFLK